MQRKDQDRHRNYGAGEPGAGGEPLVALQWCLEGEESRGYRRTREVTRTQRKRRKADTVLRHPVAPGLGNEMVVSAENHESTCPGASANSVWYEHRDPNRRTISHIEPNQ